MAGSSTGLCNSSRLREFQKPRPDDCTFLEERAVADNICLTRHVSSTWTPKELKYWPKTVKQSPTAFMLHTFGVQVRAIRQRVWF